MTSVQDSPLVSVVIPTHNRRVLLQEAVESCLRQTWERLEVIIVDDGSTDGTEQLVMHLLSTSWSRDRVRYMRQENRGASAARNHGLRLARGDYIQFLDSDDLLDSTKLAKQVRALERPENRQADCCSCYGRAEEWADGAVVGSAMRIGVHAATPGQVVQDLCARRVHGMQTSAPLWRRDFLVQRPGWREDITVGDDLEYYVRLLVECRSLCFVDEPLFVVRQHGGPRLSADRMTEASLTSIIRTRQAIFEAVQRARLWNSDTQSAFLGAMRTIYANALTLGNPDIIRELEGWLWSLASTPTRRHAVRSLILSRQLLGRRFLLGAHRLVKRLRAA